MKSYLCIWTIGALGILGSMSLLACTNSNAAPNNLPNPVNQPRLEMPAHFEIGPLNVKRSGVSVGEVAKITTTITNVGDKPGTYVAILTQDGEEVDRAIAAIAPRRTAEVNFKIVLTTPGSKKLAIGDSTATINAYEWPFMIYYDSDTRLGGAGHEHGAQSHGAVQTLTPPISIRGNYGHMVSFTPPAVPFKIQKIFINGEARIKDKNEWDNKHVTVRIWDDNYNMLWSADLPWRLFRYPGDWNEIIVPNLRVKGNFNVELVTHSGEKNIQTIEIDYSDDPTDAGIYISWDRPQTYLSSPTTIAETPSVISNMGKPVDVPSVYQGLNWYIRVIGDGS